MMKILIIATIEATIRSFLIPHIKHLQDKGYEVALASNFEGIDQALYRPLGVEIYHIPFSRNLFDFANAKSFFMIRNLLKSNSFCAIHTHTPIASFLSRLACPSKVKVLYTAHGFHFHENGGKLGNLIYFLAEKIAAYKTDRLIVMNTDDWKAAERLTSSNKVKFIKGIGVDLDYYKLTNETMQEDLRQELHLSPKNVTITYLAEFIDRKRHIDIIRAGEILKQQQIQNFIILLAGSGPNQKAIQEEIDKKDLDQFVKCIGYRRDVVNLLSITDIGLMISSQEGLPRSMMEMMAMKIPVIATDIRGNRDLIVDGHNGYLIEVNNPVMLAKRIMALLEDADLRMHYGWNAQEKMIQECSLKKILSDMNQVYEGLNL